VPGILDVVPHFGIRAVKIISENEELRHSMLLLL
jgi:hypothetical protein